MMKMTDEEVSAAKASETFQASHQAASDAYNKAAGRFTRMAKKLDDKECERLQKLAETERKREWAHRQKVKDLEEMARRAGNEAAMKAEEAALERAVKELRKKEA